MSFYLKKKPSIISESITLYYTGNNRWSDNAENKIAFETRDEAEEHISNPDGKNGGFTNCVIFSD